MTPTQKDLLDKGINDVIVFQSETKRIWLSDFIDQQIETKVKEAVMKAYGDCKRNMKHGGSDITAKAYYNEEFKQKKG